MFDMFQQNQFSTTSFITIFILLYGLVIIGMYLGQRSLLYHPDSTKPLLSEYGLLEGSDLVHVPSHDGLFLYSWYRKPSGKNKPLIIFFHGNAGHIGGRADRLRFFRDQGYGFLISSYRYNANSHGKPSEESLIRDGQSVINWALKQGYDIEDIILYGESLGSGIAVSLAQNNLSKAIILEGPYSSISDVAADKYWFLPVRWLIKDEFNSQIYIRNLMQPILILHGEKDKTIPFKFAQKLHDNAGKKAQLEVFPEGGHVDLYDHGAGKIVKKFIEKL